MTNDKTPFDDVRVSMAQNKTIYEVLGREPVHPFPARMAPGLALEVLAESGKPIRVLDPMMGSGTVLALSRAQGHHAFGVDIDPLAVLITRVWTTAIDACEVRAAATDVLAEARDLFRAILTRDAYPATADEETRSFVRFWFDAYSRRQLTALSSALQNVSNSKIRNALWCAFSRLIITKQSGASLAMDLSHSRPHKVFVTAPIKPFNRFIAAVERTVSNCIDDGAARRGPATSTYEGDARALPLSNNSIDLVLTSPPYLNAIDYFRCSKFSLVWMGYTIGTLRQLRSASVGTEVGSRLPPSQLAKDVIGSLAMRPALGPRDERILTRYITDIESAVGEVRRVLTMGGKAVYVIGENTVRRTYIRNATLIYEVARACGLHFIDSKIRELPANRRYLPPPTGKTAIAALDARMRREVILSFEKRR